MLLHWRRIRVNALTPEKAKLLAVTNEAIVILL